MGTHLPTPKVIRISKAGEAEHPGLTCQMSHPGQTHAQWQHEHKARSVARRHRRKGNFSKGPKSTYDANVMGLPPGVLSTIVGYGKGDGAVQYKGMASDFESINGHLRKMAGTPLYKEGETPDETPDETAVAEA